MKLSDIKEHLYTIDFGTEVKLYDAWQTLDNIQLANEGNPFDNIRKGFGFPTEKEVEQAVKDGKEKPLTLTKSQCMELNSDLNKFITDLECVKTLKNLNKA